MAARTDPTPNAEPARSLIRKLAEVMAEVDRVPKTRWNDFHKYHYATEADITEAVRTGLAARSVMMLPSVEDVTRFEVPGKSKVRHITQLTMRFTFLDGDSGERETIRVIGDGEDDGDKGPYKAMTGALKYAVMKSFLIPTGDDPEQTDAKPKRSRGPSPAVDDDTSERVVTPAEGKEIIALWEQLTPAESQTILNRWTDKDLPVTTEGTPDVRRLPRRRRKGVVDFLTNLIAERDTADDPELAGEATRKSIMERRAAIEAEGQGARLTAEWKKAGLPQPMALQAEQLEAVYVVLTGIEADRDVGEPRRSGPQEPPPDDDTRPF